MFLNASNFKLVHNFSVWRRPDAGWNGGLGIHCVLWHPDFLFQRGVKAPFHNRRASFAETALPLTMQSSVADAGNRQRVLLGSFGTIN